MLIKLLAAGIVDCRQYLGEWEQLTQLDAPVTHGIANKAEVELPRLSILQSFMRTEQ